MGLIYFGIPPGLMLAAKQLFGVETFIETGTYRGDTVALAMAHFKSVYSVDCVADNVRAAQARFAHHPPTMLGLGNSPDFLQQVLKPLGNSSVLFWLDSHWDGQGAEPEVPCPLLDELHAINNSQIDAFIVIDDVRYFLAPPPAPHTPSKWPTISQLMPAVEANGRHVIIIDDVIVAWPKRAQTCLTQYARSRRDFMGRTLAP